jgi:RNA polymerase sigma factor (sigma-70 family)
MEQAMVGQDEAEFEVFYRTEFKPLIWFVIRTGASPSDAEDVAQEAMRATWSKWPAVDSPRAYARTAALRVLYRMHGRLRREQAAAVRAAGSEQSTSGLFDSEVRQVIRALHALPRSQREVIALVMDGYEPTEIADITGQNPATVRSNLRHARQRLTGMTAQRPEVVKKEAKHGS